MSRELGPFVLVDGMCNICRGALNLNPTTGTTTYATFRSMPW